MFGFTKGDTGELRLAATDKASIRALHNRQRTDRLYQQRAFLKDRASILLPYFANGSEVDPRQIKLKLDPVKAGSIESELFRLATLTWSVPVSNGFGRRLRYLIRDEQNDKIVGLFALGDPVFNLRARDSLIGWQAADRAKRLVNMLDAYVLGAVPPYNLLLGGKAVACLVRSKEVYEDFALKYGSACGVISKIAKNASLLAVTTSSSLGRSSLYNRLRLHGVDYFSAIGFTGGWGHFHIPDRLFSDLRQFLREKGHDYADQNRFGQGPNWRMRTARVALKALGFDESLLRHGIRRQLFISEFAPNSIALLRSGDAAPNISELKTISEISSLSVERWMIPRSERRPEFKLWKRHKLLDNIFAKPRPEEMIERLV